MEVVESCPNYSIELTESKDIMAMRFIGDMADPIYKEMWEKSLKISVEHEISRFIIDQTKIGHVSFTTRGWVVMKMFPRLKKALGGNVHAAVRSSENAIHKAGVQFLAKAFVKLSGYGLEFVANDEDGIEWLRKVRV